MKYFFRAFTKFSFSGRVNRKEYGVFYLIMLILMFVLAYIDGLTGLYITTMSNQVGIISTIFTLVVFLPAYSMITKRLHDIGKSGSWSLLLMAPLVGTIFLFVLFLKKGDPGINQYGPPSGWNAERSNDIPPTVPLAQSVQQPIQVETAAEASPLPPTCKHCGKPLLLDAGFCSYCGNKVEVEEPAEEPEPIKATPICVQCGRELLEEAEFCPYCGNKVERPEELPKPEKAVDPAVEPTAQVQVYSVQPTEQKKPKARLKAILLLPVVFVIIVGYFGINYFSATNALNNQEFTKAKQSFDNMFVGEQLFADKYAYAEAGVLMENGAYVDAYKAFNAVKNISVPASITSNLKDKIYSAGQAAYRDGDLDEAEKNFSAIKKHKRSDDYLFLIDCKESSFSTYISRLANYDKLVALIGFEDADDIIIQNNNLLEEFLLGRWEDGDRYDPYYFELTEEDDGLWSSYNLPRNDVDGLFDLIGGVYSVEGTKYWRFSIIDEDTISAYCYKDGSTIKLYRQ